MESIPSWVPRWRPSQSGLLSPWSLNDNFAASHGLDLHLDTSSPSSLGLRGIHVSTVWQTGPGPIASENDITSSIDWLVGLPFADDMSPFHLEVYSRTFCAGRDAYGSRERDRTAMTLPFVAFAIYGALPDTELFRWIDMGRKCLPVTQQSARKEDSHSSGGSWNAWNAEWNAGRASFGRVAGLAARGRRLFITANGHLGLGPESIRNGDSVYVLGGSTMPLILRPAGDSRNVLVGPSYIDDLMDGQAVKAAETGNAHFGPLWSESFRQTMVDHMGGCSARKELGVGEVSLH